MNNPVTPSGGDILNDPVGSGEGLAHATEEAACVGNCPDQDVPGTQPMPKPQRSQVDEESAKVCAGMYFKVRGAAMSEQGKEADDNREDSCGMWV